MHLPDGFLSPVLTLPAYATSAPLWALGVRRHFGPSQVEALPVLGSLTAVAFVIQTLMIPVPGGTSTHLLGVPLLALLYGPLAAFVAESLVLALQALFFGAGGVTVLAVNALALGLLGPTAGWLVHRALRRVHAGTAAFLGAFTALLVAAAAIVGALGLQQALDPAYFPSPLPVVAGAMLVPTVLAGLAEGAYTLVALRLLARVRGVGTS